MKPLLTIFITISFFTFTSCSKNESNGDLPTNSATLHDALEIDINEDGVKDYKIKYSYVDIEPLTISSGVFGITGSLEPFGNNEILRHRDEKSLFLRNLAEIEENVSVPLNWRNTFSRTIVSIATKNAEGDWPNKWDINSDTNHSTYFLGLKLVSDNLIQLAWVEIEINKNDGSVSLLNKGIL